MHRNKARARSLRYSCREKREHNRFKLLERKGYKLFKIIHEQNNPVLPSDEILLQIKQIAVDFLLNTKNTYIHFNFDENYIHIKNFTIKVNLYKKISNDIYSCLLENAQIGED